ncbi:MAG: ATP-dependent RecD-like DNA helicase [Candidatus Methanoperedens nitroreducens]|uniref:ATP-dependent RecD-like DNA helicase n=1 Tax=Candidatus Methanoperedens nitratireducens TaxID=1392998 RepID=A0A0P8CBL0_9EURY|nr:AAA family ATPase [Candidatus Methanoperedens sp. BLZ2]KAB2943371.1 MAG: AAA family ATPase [Candidatus Methanoperedens sp.]KPQ44228.1 MAG: ATP-dependent RecD-like DNA helicase [Candidatus Methanoperedens sp. BLZ1]MBZ0173830.1 AAA family ATPase [Candidatus Methanoperedens nitroreducens]MCX9077626.1 AAA family ATPase [Candidatus Methanoperedens sp.]
MVTHVSVRLSWHDRGWDGCICNEPKKNVYCGGFFSVNAERIRYNKDNEWEESNHGKPCRYLKNQSPPCTETINVFGEQSIGHIHLPKEFLEGAEELEETLPPHSSGTWPFEEMWDEKGNRRDPDERKEIAEEFFSDLKKGEGVSLIFYYCNYDNPITGQDRKYLLTGIVRLKKVGGFKKWPQIPTNISEKYGDFVWSITLESAYPNEGIRIPYQEYMDKKIDPASIAIIVSGDLTRRFKYVCRHVSDDEAIGLIDQAIKSIKKVIKDNYLPDAGYWDSKLQWLKQIRKECWESRGLYPGLTNTLEYLNFPNPSAYVRIELPKKNPNDLREYIFDRLDGKIKMNTEELERYGDAAQRYRILKSSPTTEIISRFCRERLPFFDLTADQIKNILGDSHDKYSITSGLNEIFDNPYCLCEEYIGKDIEDTIGFHRIDHGMIPSEELGKNIPRIKFDDPRRLRALMVEQLKASANEGHTFIDRSDLFAAIEKWHKDNDPDSLFILDKAIWEQHKVIFTKKLMMDIADGIEAIFLNSIHADERIIRKEIVSFLNEELLPSSKIDWKKILNVFQLEDKEHPSIREAIAEQACALETMYRARFSVLTGSAGTGKTTVLRSLVKGITDKEPNHSFLLLAPTGKAAIILGLRVQREATTIHTFLMGLGWINPLNYTLKERNNRRKGNPGTIIVDEASMLNVSLFATLVRAIDLGTAERLILVGDSGQLPPIGPGKPFADIIDYLKKDDNREHNYLAELTVNCRQATGSRAAWLASHFTRTLDRPDEEILWDVERGISKGDFSVYTWNNDEDLYKLIPQVLENAIAMLEGKKKLSGTLGDRYNYVHGLNDLYSPKKNLEAIQLLAPYRHTPSGVEYLNQIVQKLLRGEDIVKKYQFAGYVHYDKIMQIRNYTYYAWNHNENKSIKNEDTYVPNGTLGFVFPKRHFNQLQAKFPKDFIKYSYYLSRSKCNEHIELGYIASVHKAQGSQFDITIVILPSEASDFLSRELIYTGLSRATGKLFLLMQKDARLLKERAWAGYSEIVKRNSALFRTAKGIPKDGFKSFHPEQLVYEALPELLVRSKGELRITQALASHGVGFAYEKPLISLDGMSWRLPDFTFKIKRREYYWEHLGMLGTIDYDKKVERKRRWYKENGWQDQLIETPIEGMNLEESIKYILEDKFGLEKCR